MTVRIAPEADARNVVATGQAPNNFSVPRGRYRVDVTKPKYQGQTRIVDIDLAETKPLFFKLEPIPARLEIETYPPGATLYVNGNRARNPYRQELAPGPVEVFAEAPNYIARSVDLTLAPAANERLTGTARLTLPYRQRSGRPELLGAATVVGGLFGAGAVVAAIGGAFQDRNVSSVLLASGGAIAGGIVGLLVATPLVPAVHPRQQGVLHHGRDVDRPRRRHADGHRRPADRHRQRHRPDAVPVPRLAAARWATSYGPAFTAASRAWRSGLTGQRAPAQPRADLRPRRDDPERRARRRLRRGAGAGRVPLAAVRVRWAKTTRNYNDQPSSAIGLSAART